MARTWLQETGLLRQSRPRHRGYRATRFSHGCVGTVAGRRKHPGVGDYHEPDTARIVSQPQANLIEYRPLCKGSGPPLRRSAHLAWRNCSFRPIADERNH